MEKIIQEIIKTAIKLEDEAIVGYLLDAQKLSGFSYKVFFDLLDTEIQSLKIRYSLSKVLSSVMTFNIDYLNQHLDRTDLIEFSRSCYSIKIRIEALNQSLNQILKKNTSSSSETISERALEKDLHFFLNRLKNDVSEKHFNLMPLSDVIDFFKPLIERTNPGGEVWMTTENFELFIRRSFGNELILDKPKIKLGSRGKYAIVKLFHKFYSKCMEEDIMENRLTEPFIELLKNAFDTKHFSQFNFKSSKSFYEWD